MKTIFVVRDSKQVAALESVMREAEPMEGLVGSGEDSSAEWSAEKADLMVVDVGISKTSEEHWKAIAARASRMTTLSSEEAFLKSLSVLIQLGSMAGRGSTAQKSEPGVVKEESPDVSLTVIVGKFEERLKALEARVSRVVPEETTGEQLPEHAVVALHDPQSGRLDGKRIAAFFGLADAELARIVGRSAQAFQKTPAAASVQGKLSVLAQIAASLITLFGTEENARVWLNAPHPDLDQERPIALVKKRKGEIVAELLEDALLGQPG